MNKELLKIISDPNGFKFFKNLPKEWIDDKYIKELYQSIEGVYTLYLYKPISHGNIKYQHCYHSTKDLKCEINNIEYSLHISYSYISISANHFPIWLEIGDSGCHILDENAHELCSFSHEDLSSALKKIEKYSIEDFNSLLNFS